MSGLTPNQQTVARSLSWLGRLLYRIFGARFIRWLAPSGEPR